MACNILSDTSVLYLIKEVLDRRQRNYIIDLIKTNIINHFNLCTVHYKWLTVYRTWEMLIVPIHSYFTGSSLQAVSAYGSPSDLYTQFVLKDVCVLDICSRFARSVIYKISAELGKIIRRIFKMVSIKPDWLYKTVREFINSVKCSRMMYHDYIIAQIDVLIILGCWDEYHYPIVSFKESGDDSDKNATYTQDEFVLLPPFRFYIWSIKSIPYLSYGEESEYLRYFDKRYKMVVWEVRR